MKEVKIGDYSVNLDYVRQFKTLSEFKKDPGIFHLHTGADRNALFEQAWEAANPKAEPTAPAEPVK